MAHWRDTYKPARFFMIDARICFLILPMMMHVRKYTVIPTILIALGLWFVEQRWDMDVSSCMRLLRSYLAGPLRRGKTPGKTTMPVDYGLFD